MITVFSNGAVFVGDGRIIDRGSVVVEDGKIIKVSSGDWATPDGAIHFDLEGHMLFPGFIDCHVHLCLDGSPNPMAVSSDLNLPVMVLKMADSMKKTLMAGVTTVRDAGGVEFLDLRMRDAAQDGVIPGPRIIASGRLVCITGGHGWQIGGREADGADDVRRAVREQIRAGCDMVKLMSTGGVITEGVRAGVPQFTEEELKAGVEEAHKAGRLTGTHAQGTEGIKNGLRAGIDIIDHGVGLDKEAVDRMLEAKTGLVPTLSAPANILKAGVGSGIPEYVISKTLPVKDKHFESIVMAREAGVRIGMGTDAGIPLNRENSSNQ